MIRKCLFTIMLITMLIISQIPCGEISLASGNVKLSKKNISLIIGKKYNIKLINAKSQKVKWQSSKNKIVTVKNGLIKAKKKGRCSVIAKYKGKKYKCNVRVRDVKKLSVTSKQETDSTLTPPSASPSVLPSAGPQNLSYPDTEANINDAKLVINNYNQDTKVMSFTILNTTQSIMTLPTSYILEKYEDEKCMLSLLLLQQFR